MISSTWYCNGMKFWQGQPAPQPRRLSENERGAHSMKPLRRKPRVPLKGARGFFSFLRFAPPLLLQAATPVAASALAGPHDLRGLAGNRYPYPQGRSLDTPHDCLSIVHFFCGYSRR